MTTKTHTDDRLDEIADRNARSRVIDIVFAALVAMLIVLSLVSLREAGASKMTNAAVSDDAGLCAVDVSAVC